MFELKWQLNLRSWKVMESHGIWRTQKSENPAPSHLRLFNYLISGPIGIRHLHISHNTPCLPPKILHKHWFQFLLGRLKHQGELKNKGYAKFWGEANKVYCGRCANGELENRNPQIKPSRSKGENYCNSKLPHMASTPEFEPGPHRWEASALTTL